MNKILKPADYSAACHRRLIESARRLMKECGREVMAIAHIVPRAYCIGKNGRTQAMFAVPVQDREPQVRDDSRTLVWNDSAKHVREGDYCALAYISSSVLKSASTAGQTYVLEINGRSSHAKETKA